MPFTTVKEEMMVSTVAEHFGFTPEHVVAAACNLSKTL
jgi:hypothetical protein